MRAAKGPRVNRRFKAAAGGSKKCKQWRPSGKLPEEEEAISFFVV